MHIQRLSEETVVQCAQNSVARGLSIMLTRCQAQHRATQLQSEKHRNVTAPARVVDVACNVALVCSIYAVVSVHSKEVEA